MLLLLVMTTYSAFLPLGASPPCLHEGGDAPKEEISVVCNKKEMSSLADDASLEVVQPPSKERGRKLIPLA